MKYRHFILPALAFIIAGAMLGGQRKSISRLEAEIGDLRTRISAIRDGTDGKDAPSIRPRVNRPSGESSPIDWKTLAGEILFLEEVDGGARKRLSLERSLLAMDVQELAAALDEIAALDIDEEARCKLELMILYPLASKDPETAFSCFKHRLFDEKEDFSWHLTRVFGGWVGKDLPAAIAWYEKEEAAGTFDAKQLSGENKTRDEYGSWLVAGMLRTDLSGAQAWLSGKSHDERKAILSGIGCFLVQESEQAALAALVRSQLDDVSRVQYLGEIAHKYAQEGDFDKVDAYLDRIDAKPDERESLFSQPRLAKYYMDSKVGDRKLRVEDLQNLRMWLVEKGSASADRLVGGSIADRTGFTEQLDFAGASALLQHFRDTPGGEAVILGFVKVYDPVLFKEETRRLAESITDPKLREQLPAMDR